MADKLDLMNLSLEETEKLYYAARQEYLAYRAQNLALNMARGKPCPEQLDISVGMLSALHPEDMIENELDVRNYGVLDGIPSCKKLMADMLGVNPEDVIIGGNSSLNMMYDTIARAMTFGVYGSTKPWSQCDRVKFLCPAPGYDRHFAICELFGIDMIPIAMTENGPDMDQVEAYVSADEAVKGIWCVPMYSNPDGITYSDETVRRFAALKPAAKDFRIFWDNAYCVHHLTDEHDSLLPLLDECRKNGTEDMVFMFASTSKVTFPGSGVAVMAASQNNLKIIKKQLGIQTIGFDKLNQLRHVKFFGDIEGLKAHMLKHRELLAPKFNIVLDTLQRELAPLGIANWNVPTGGYFVSVNTLEGCAKRVVALCKRAGVELTGAGATYPYGVDPHDCNIRIAPSYPSCEELQTAIDLFCLAVRLASLEKRINDLL